MTITQPFVPLMVSFAAEAAETFFLKGQKWSKIPKKNFFQKMS